MLDRDCSQAMPLLFPLPEATCASLYTLLLTHQLSYL